MTKIDIRNYEGSIDTDNTADCKFQININGNIVCAMREDSDEFLISCEDIEYMLVNTTIDEVRKYLQ